MTLPCYSSASDDKFFHETLSELVSTWGVEVTTPTSQLKFYRFTEIELYLFSPTHPDIYTHRHIEQRSNQTRWYFHRLGKSNSFKGGTYKGLDLVVSDGEVYAGVLIRGIVEVDLAGDPIASNIAGPCLVVNHLLEMTGTNEVPVLHERKDELLCPIKFHSAITPIYKGIRFGLKPETAPHFHEKHYRYLSEAGRKRAKLVRSLEKI